MEKYIYILISVFLVGFYSCSDDFLDRKPMTDISPELFFKTVTDLETYSNGFYKEMKAPYHDQGTDNISISTGTNIMDQIVSGSVSSSTVGTHKDWNDDNWGKLRSINFFLNNAHNATGIETDINHYVGIGKFFRAKFYYDKLKNYSDVPWYNKTMDENDQDMYKAADPRKLVADSILRDLEYAVTTIKSDLGSKTRVNKWTALTLLARFSLYEGTFRKYHPEVNLTSDYERFLDKAIWACEEIIKGGKFKIYGNTPEAFGNLFCSAKLTDNPEVILIQESNQGLNVTNNTNTVLAWQWSLSRSLMESYLMKDGTPFTQQKDYDKKIFTEVFKDRDPRLAETIVYPGFKISQKSSAHVPSAKFGGYDQLKFYPKDEALRGGWDKDLTSLPIYRYAEILLIYAEALAEKGKLTQSLLDQTVNQLRNRVGMPALNMATANATIDPQLAAQYPNVTGSNKGVILEIRRERRVELACEGLRLEDLKRWYAGKNLEKRHEGVYIPQLGAYDMTGDGVVDFAVLGVPADTVMLNIYPADVRKNINRYFLKTKDGADEGFYLTEDTKGHIAFVAHKKNPLSFVEPKYYYVPIPKLEIQLNPNLKQPFGWD